MRLSSDCAKKLVFGMVSRWRLGEMAIETVNPATGEVLKVFGPLTDAQVDEKIALAAAAFAEYRYSTFVDRRRMMLRAAEILESDKETFGRLMTTEMGKTLRSAVDEA